MCVCVTGSLCCIVEIDKINYNGKNKNHKKIKAILPKVYIKLKKKKKNERKKGHMACKAENIYYLAHDRKSLLTPTPELLFKDIFIKHQWVIFRMFRFFSF